MTLLKNQQTAASARAEWNWRANLAALAGPQPWIVDAAGSLPADVTWIFGRDGFLTCHDVTGRWWAGCSLPKRAGDAMLKTLDVRGVMGCFLAPAHAGQVAAALERLKPEQAVLVIQPELADLRVLLGCGDFAEDINKHRLWFATGTDWRGMLSATFERHPGLPTPVQFIRTQTTEDELVNQLIPLAEKVLNAVNDSRTKRLQEVARPVANGEQARGSHESKRLLLLAPSHFRLWDDAGHALLGALSSERSRHLDPDDPAQSSAMGLALAAGESDAIVTANVARAGLPAGVPDRVAVLTWVTQPRIPAPNARFARDGLLLADPTWLNAAKSAGWPAARLRVAYWPTEFIEPPTGISLALIANTSTLEIPVTRLDASSHHVLWEMIRSELAADPFSLGTDVNGFLARRREKLGISAEGFDQALFIDQLIVPAYQQALAKMLFDAGLPIKLYGMGWNQLLQLRDAWEGNMETRQAFREAVRGAAVLVHAWPIRYGHPIDALGRPVLAAAGKRTENWVQAAKEIRGTGAGDIHGVEALTLRTVHEMLD